jgi:hypothetical protein
MGVTTKKYGVSINFWPKLAIFIKTVGQHLCISSENVKLFKTHKTSYMRPLWITDLQYGVHDQEIRSFDQFLPQTGDFH